MSEIASGPTFTRLPIVELVHDVEAEIVDQIADAGRHHDRLIGRDLRKVRRSR